MSDNTEVAISMPVTADLLRQAMRHWTTGVSVVTSCAEGICHGMTVNSFTSVSLEPPLVTVTLNQQTRTQALVAKSRVFGVTILREGQEAISERFAGRQFEAENRLAGLETFCLVTGAPLLKAGLVGLDCRVVFEYPMPDSVLYIAEVLAIQLGEPGWPLVYHNRAYHQLQR
jgi:flavin reductase (DIM6/NTAB) family NADH-FMN oxidoreductase RutF